jgi:Tat protein translocase TatB subunit
MFDVGFSEIALVAVVALLVLGPERLPKVARTVGALVRRARSSWQGVRSEIERELAAEDLKRTITMGIEGTAMPAFNLMSPREIDLKTSGFSVGSVGSSWTLVVGTRRGYFSSGRSMRCSSNRPPRSSGAGRR